MNKYKAKRTDGYDSKKEASYALKLKAMMKCATSSQRVAKIEEQVKFEIIPQQVDENGRIIERAAHYIADFRVTYGDGRVEVIDVKSAMTKKLPAYILKRKLMLHVHGIRVVEV